MRYRNKNYEIEGNYDKFNRSFMVVVERISIKY